MTSKLLSSRPWDIATQCYTTVGQNLGTKVTNLSYGRAKK